MEYDKKEERLLKSCFQFAVKHPGMAPVKLRSRLRTFRWKLLTCWMAVPSFGAALKYKPHLEGVSRDGCYSMLFVIGELTVRTLFQVW